MLVITRERGQRFFCSDAGGPLVEVEVVDIRGDKVRLGITAPNEIKVLRDELAPSTPKPPKTLPAA